MKESVKVRSERSLSLSLCMEPFEAMMMDFWLLFFFSSQKLAPFFSSSFEIG